MLKEYDIDKLNPRRTSYAKELQQQKSIKYCLECFDMNDWDKLREKLNLSEEDEMIIDEEKEKIRTAEGGFDMFKAIEEWAADERAEGKAEIVENMLKNKKTIEEIVDFCNLPEDFVREVEKRMHVTV